MKLKLLMMIGALSGWGFASMIPDDPVLAVWKPKEGAKLRYRFTNNHGGGTAPKMVVSWSNLTSIEKVFDGKVKLHDQNDQLQVTVGGKDGNPGIQVGDMDRVCTLRGDVVEESDGEGFGFLFSHFGGFRFPDRALKADEEWSLTLPAEKERPAAKVTIVFRGREKFKDSEALKFEFDFSTSKDGPGTSGTVWISPEDGALFKRISKLVNVDFGGGPEEMTQEVERIG